MAKKVEISEGVKTADVSTSAVFETENIVGKLACKLFSDDEAEKMVEITSKLIAEDVKSA